MNKHIKLEPKQKYIRKHITGLCRLGRDGWFYITVMQEKPDAMKSGGHYIYAIYRRDYDFGVDYRDRLVHVGSSCCAPPEFNITKKHLKSLVRDYYKTRYYFDRTKEIVNI